MSDHSQLGEINVDLSADEADLLDEILSELGGSRREFLGKASAASLGAVVLQFLANKNVLGGTDVLGAPQVFAGENAVTVGFTANGVKKTLTVDSRVTLLDALRESLGLTGTKKGCDHGQCGACTVIVDGHRVLSCLTLTAQCEGKEITTIEGVAKGGELHPLQAAFIKHDGFQCGYCTPGQICSAVALMQEAKNGDLSYASADMRQTPRPLMLSDDEIKERMSGNLCRCGAYPNIVAAIREVHTGKPTDPLQAGNFDEKEAADATV
ncbi:MAG: 2Fe-2S iron-sulfur cluster-binding protein [Acidobacteriota bacterium]